MVEGLNNMDITLRPYQKEAIEKILWSQQLEGGDLCVLPTGAGKSIVIADLAKRLNQPILIIQPSKEILEQNYLKLCKYVQKHDIGIYSASMEQKVIRYFTFATIQSIYKKPADFQHFKIVLIDECHNVNPKNLDGMFTKFLREIGNPKVVGFTATPYRLGLTYAMKYDPKYRRSFLNGITSTKLINRMKERFWHRIIYNINNGELLQQGYLSPLEYIDRTIIDQTQIPINKSGSDFDLEGYEKKISDRENEILSALTYAKKNAKHVLVFCSSIRQAERLQTLTPGSTVVTSKTHKTERDEIVENFKLGITQIVFNVGVLTTGFDHPTLDCIVLIRPTRSIGLYYQMLGRGVRLAPGKKSCKIIDLTSTVRHIGRIETIKLEKIDNKWELISERGSWHNRQLYSFTVRPPTDEPTQQMLY